MSPVQSPIRLQRWQADERRRYVAELESLAERLRQELARLAEERRAEPAAKVGDVGYARLALERRRTLEQSLADVETQIAQARDALGEALQELKRHETAAANRERIRLQRVARRKGIDLDALAVERVRRRSGGE